MSRRAGWMGEVPLHFGRTEGTREQRARHTRVRPVSCWRSGFHPPLDFPGRTRGSPPRAAGLGREGGGQLGGRQRCHPTDRDRVGQHPRPLPRNRDASPEGSSPGLEAPGGARTRGCGRGRRLLPAPGSRRRRSPGRRRGGGTDPSQEVWGKVPEGTADPTLSPPAGLVFWCLFVFESVPAQHWEVAESVGVGPAAAPSDPVWPGGGQRRSVAGRRREREATWGWRVGGKLTPCVSP